MSSDAAFVNTPPNKINRLVYRDEAIYRTEMQRVFRRSWIYVCHESELAVAGNVRTATIAEQPVVVSRDKSGALTAFYNTCTHRGATLVVGAGGRRPGPFVCPYHNWSFDHAGRCLAITQKKAYGEELDLRKFDIPQIRVQSFCGFVFVSIDPLENRLEDFLGEVGVHLRDFSYRGRGEMIGRMRHIYDGNWKLWHENFTDGYHPTFTHRWVRDIEADYPGTDGTNAHLRPGHTMLTWNVQVPMWHRLSGSLKKISGYEHDAEKNPDYFAPPCEGPAGQYPQWKILSIFPNLDLQPVNNTTILEVVHPRGPGRSELEVIVFGVKGESADHRQYRLRRVATFHGAMGKVAADDVDAVERCQRGFAAEAVRVSDMSRGVLERDAGTTQDEHGLRGFYATWKHYMSTT